jgi:hypothetical protein
MQLQHLQRLFQRHVLEGYSGIEAELTGSEAEDFPARLATYTDGYRSRLLEALSTSFPGLKAALGDAEFERVLHKFIESAPSKHYSIRYYGHSLGDYIRSLCAEPDAPAIQDLVRWEWTLAEVFDAPDAEPIGAECLAAISPDVWPRVAFALRACVRSVTTRSNAVQWWRWAKDEGVRPPAFEHAPATNWRLWRQGVRTLYRSMDAAESAALAVAQASGTFGEICEVIAEEVGVADAPSRAASIMNAWFADEIIGNLTVVPIAPGTPGLK